MKTAQKTSLAILLLSVAMATYTSCTKESTSGTNMASGSQLKSADQNLTGSDECLFTRSGSPSKSNPGSTYECINSFPAEPLSSAEISALNTMREEELLAKDIYSKMYLLYKIPVFDNISESEYQHTTAIKALLDKYDLQDIASNHVTGVFVNPAIQALYTALLTQGNSSLNDGLLVGATIEDLDIQDLINHIENDVDNADILFVFNELQKGSRNHMRSFYKLLEKRGLNYSPQYITLEYFNQIISSPRETGTGCPS